MTVAGHSDRPWSGRRLHLVGVGGAGMSGYARVAVQLGAQVSGSDRADSPVLARLSALGVEVHVGHARANVPGDAEVFCSSAIAADNPERVDAARPRADLLGELSALRRVIAVAGTHGKTTTTSMVAHALLACGFEPGYLIGGVLRSTGEHADWGAGEWLVVEADESDRSMLALDVAIAVVLNVELDHHATFGSLRELRAVFRTFLAGAPRAVVPGDPAVRALVAPATEAVTFGAPEQSRWRGHDLALAVPGAHNLLNAAAALEACRLAGADAARAVSSLASFTGAARRFERLGLTASGALVVDDYAHHPTAVEATISAARSVGAGRVVAVFQPHLFSRTRELHREFGLALALADTVVVLDVYPARERAEDFPGVSGRLVAQAVADAGREVVWAPRHADADAVLGGLLRRDDLCLVMGAGDSDALARGLVAQPSHARDRRSP